MGASRPGARRLPLRSPQLAHGVGSMLAVLILVGASWSGAALWQSSEEELVSIASDGSIGSEGISRPRHVASNQPRRAAVRREPPPTTGSERGSLLGLNATQRHSYIPGFSGSTTTTPSPDDGIPLFNWDGGGSWLGTEDRFNGEYGFAFEPNMDLDIIALGRYVNNEWNHQGLYEPAMVTLWRSATKEALQTVEIGAVDHLEIHGKYMFKYLEPPIALKAKHEYRITQTCRAGMNDTWFDDVARATDVELYSAFECIKCTTGVYGEKKGEWPTEIEETYRRVGMLNLKLKGGAYGNCGMSAADRAAGPTSTTRKITYW